MAVYNSNYTGAQVDAAVGKVSDITKTAAQINNLNQVDANPTLAGTEADLTGLKVGNTKYKVPTGTNVVANPTLAGTEATLEGLEVGATKYKVPDNVIANPTLAGTEADLTGLQVGSTKYKVPSGGGSSQLYLHTVRFAYPASGSGTGMKYSLELFIINNNTTSLGSVDALLDHLDTLVEGTQTTLYPMFTGYVFNLSSSTDTSRPIQQITYNTTTGNMAIYYMQDNGSGSNFNVTRNSPSSGYFINDNISKLF